MGNNQYTPAEWDFIGSFLPFHEGGGIDALRGAKFEGLVANQYEGYIPFETRRRIGWYLAEVRVRARAARIEEGQR